jgi:phosphoribosyl-ATP pyrophosphohydrolase
MIRPAIELRGSSVVAHQPDGTEVRLPGPAPDLAARLFRLGELRVHDVGAEQGEPAAEAAIQQICRVAECVVGGGIRDARRADALLRAGARQVLLEANAAEDLLAQLPRSKVILAFDLVDGQILPLGGGQTELGNQIQALQDRCTGYHLRVSGSTRQAISAHLTRFEALRSRLPNHTFTLEGGIASLEDVTALDRAGLDCQLLEGALPGGIDLVEAYLALIDFDKSNGLVPVIVQDDARQVVSLMQANRAAVQQSLTTGQATYWSPHRGKHWVKGSTSGHTQELVTCLIDCDRDTLLFTVRAQGTQCHLGRYSCFEEMAFSLPRLEHALRARQGTVDPRKSYTQMMLADREGVKRKLQTEAISLVSAMSRDDVLYETADLLYFVMLNLVQEGVALDEVVRELRGRAGRRRS